MTEYYCFYSSNKSIRRKNPTLYGIPAYTLTYKYIYFFELYSYLVLQPTGYYRFNTINCDGNLDNGHIII